VGEKARALWAKVQPGDVVVFYTTGVGVIGYGVVEGKFESSESHWPKEKEQGKVICLLHRRESIRETETHTQKHASRLRDQQAQRRGIQRTPRPTPWLARLSAA